MIKGELETVYEEAYERLNTAQKRAVDTIDGPVMVIAGPGTGKTQILALRIANILRQTDTKPENILALTFTDAGAHAMRERLTTYLGEAAYRVSIHTFHSFAGEAISRYPDSYSRIIGGRPASEIEKLSIIEEIINSGQFKLLRPHGDPLYYVNRIPGAISDLKKEYVTPDIFSQRIAREEANLALEPRLHEKGAHKGKVRHAYLDLEKQINKHKELLAVYRQYEATMRERRLFDFEDMIIETVAALEGNQDMLRDLQESYQYILADEHQDVNEAQNKILELLADYHERPNVFVVGDEKQAIYRFQGASLENFLFFENRFPGTVTISLTDNYRSRQEVLDAAFELIKTDDENLAKLRLPLTAAAALGVGRLEWRQFSNQAIEDEWLISEVKTAIHKGTPPEEIAIITRYNKDVVDITTTLRQAGVEASPSADSDILDHPVTMAVENLIKSVIRVDDESALFETLLGGWWGIEARDLALVLSSRSGSWPLYRLIASEERLQELNVTNPAAFLRIATILESARTEFLTKSPHQILHHLVRESGLLDQLMESDPIDGGRVLRRVYDEIESMTVGNRKATLVEVVKQLEYRRLHNLPLEAPFIGANNNAVRVMTAHKSKGLEFHTVIIPRASDKAFGGGKKRDLFKLPLMEHAPVTGLDQEDDERRLLFVAMTRAKSDLLISCSEIATDGKFMDPSRFFADINEEKLPKTDTQALGAEFKPSNLFQSPLQRFELQPQIIKDLFLTRGLSVTHLNNYLEDPMKYYYENLLRRPHPRDLSLLRGEAVHEVLERVAKQLISGKETPSATIFSKWLDEAIAKLPLSLTDAAAIHERAFAALTAYVPTLKQVITSRSRTELALKVTLATGDPELPEIPLTGKIDRVDYRDDGSILRVVDYKTGKAKSKNEVEGLTKNSNGNYKRQLTFYALLLSLYDSASPAPESFMLSFVEPKEKSGEIVEYSFGVTEQEISELKSEILRISKEIVSGSFLKV